uniref:Uncharacterized protein n=1 Tax=Oryza rufipogon TaxID=4529 RepID=A0A0E0QCC4_ORYRU
MAGSGLGGAGSAASPHLAAASDRAGLNGYAHSRDIWSKNSLMGECCPVFTGFWGAMLLWKVVASGNLQWSSLLEANFAAAPQSIPIIALSFVYQNVVPVLCTNLEGDLSKVRKAIVVGTAIPLALFLIWDAVILGTLPGLAGDGTIIDPIEQLRSSNGTVGPIVEAFSFLAIGTSYIGFVLGLSDFIADSAMSWSERYSDDLEAPVPPIVPGGKFTLSFVMGGALLVIFSEIFKDIMQLQGLH